MATIAAANSLVATKSYETRPSGPGALFPCTFRILAKRDEARGQFHSEKGGCPRRDVDETQRIANIDSMTFVSFCSMGFEGAGYKRNGPLPLHQKEFGAPHALEQLSHPRSHGEAA